MLFVVALLILTGTDSLEASSESWIRREYYKEVRTTPSGGSRTGGTYPAVLRPTYPVRNNSLPRTSATNVIIPVSVSPVKLSDPIQVPVRHVSTKHSSAIQIPVHRVPTKPNIPVPVPVSIMPSRHPAFHLSRDFLMQGRITSQRYGMYQINMGTSYIWDRFSEDITSKLIVLPYPFLVSNMIGGTERLTRFAPNQAFELGNYRVNGINIALSEKEYPVGSHHVFGQVGFGKRSPFAQHAVIFKAGEGGMAVSFSANGFAKFCADGTNVTSLRLLLGTGDRWEVLGRVAVGDDDNLHESDEQRVRIESIHDFVEMDQFTLNRFKEVMQLMFTCDVAEGESGVLLDQCPCREIVKLGPQIRYDLDGDAKIVVYPNTYIERDAASEHRCLARVRLQKQDGVLIAGRPFLESAVTVLDTSNNPSMSVCQSRF